MRILVLNGPNLNLLGRREPGVYGTATLAEIERRTRERTHHLDVEQQWVQLNAEGALVEQLHAAVGVFAGVVFNPGGYTHTSVALRDAIVGTGLAVVEIHLSNVQAREPFRRRSVLAGVCVGQVSGFGADSYRLGIEALVDWLRRQGPRPMPGTELA